MQIKEELRGAICVSNEQVSTSMYPTKQMWVVEYGRVPSNIYSMDYVYSDKFIKRLSELYEVVELACSQDLHIDERGAKVLKTNNVIRVTNNISIEFMDTSYKNKFNENLRSYMSNDNYDDLFVTPIGLSKNNKVSAENRNLNFSDFDRTSRFIIFYDETTDPEELEKITQLSKEFYYNYKTNKDKSRINLVVQTRHGYSLSNFELNKPKIDISLNYGDGLNSIHDLIVSRLNEKNGKGVLLLHGLAGSGKTNYIKLLLSLINKTVIYVPPMMAEFISSEAFIPFLMDYPNSVLVIEDGENIVKKRTGGASQAVSNILNLSDGILGECLKMQVIITFNASKSEVDDALLRKGRLIAEHKFDKLSVESAQKLSDELGFDTKITEPMVLTDIYNQNENDFKSGSKRNKMGF